MNDMNFRFLQVLRAALKGEKMNRNDLTPEQWRELLAMAEAAGYDGFCSAEHYGVADQWDFVVKSAKWLGENM